MSRSHVLSCFHDHHITMMPTPLAHLQGRGGPVQRGLGGREASLWSIGAAESARMPPGRHGRKKNLWCSTCILLCLRIVPQGMPFSGCGRSQDVKLASRGILTSLKSPRANPMFPPRAVAPTLHGRFFFGRAYS